MKWSTGAAALTPLPGEIRDLGDVVGKLPEATFGNQASYLKAIWSELSVKIVIGDREYLYIYKYINIYIYIWMYL